MHFANNYRCCEIFRINKKSSVVFKNRCCLPRTEREKGLQSLDDGCRLYGSCAPRKVVLHQLTQLLSERLTSTEMTGDRSSQVRVGVRVRPLAAKEIQHGGNVSMSVFPPSSITIASNKTFTYDAVFDSQTNQDELYNSVSSSLLESFVDGFNATVSSGAKRAVLIYS